MVSTFRLYLLRATYLMIFLFVSTSFWPSLIHPSSKWTLLSGVARCFFAALGPLVFLGLRYPLKMLPVLLFELLWKATWLAAIGIPAWMNHQVDADMYETIKACALGVILFPAVIPWPYIWEQYVKAPGDRWGFGTKRSMPERESAPALSR